MSDVFLDTVGLIAVWNSSDQWHPAADVVYRSLLSQGRRLVTTHLVLAECGNVAARRPYRRRVNALRCASRPCRPGSVRSRHLIHPADGVPPGDSADRSPLPLAFEDLYHGLF